MNESWATTLTQHGAQFENGRVQTYNSLHTELTAAEDGTVFGDLSHEGLILASGDDAIAFLQGQFSNDVLILTTDGEGERKSEGKNSNAQWNSWSSPKGRLLATFLMWRGKQGVFMQLPRALQPAIQKRLSMFVLRSKVKLDDISSQWVKLGIADRNANRLEANIHEALGSIDLAPMQTTHTALGRIIRLSPHRFEVVASIENAALIWQKLSTLATPVGAPVWEGFAIREGIITILPETQDAFVAQMANFELIGGVNFKKGCYPGQEIVARTQYRGILKRRMVWVHGKAEIMPKPGDSIYAPEFPDQAAGQIANIAPSLDGGFDALVVAQLESINANSLRLTDAADGQALSIQSLPYPFI